MISDRCPSPWLWPVSLLSSPSFGRPLIRLLHHWRIGKQIRVELPNSHRIKMALQPWGIDDSHPHGPDHIVLNFANF